MSAQVEKLLDEGVAVPAKTERLIVPQVLLPVPGNGAPEPTIERNLKPTQGVLTSEHPVQSGQNP